jgi:8-oxo-dGTP pyrophosphatase MutT (NUDIX family)
MSNARIVKTLSRPLSPWVTLQERSLVRNPGAAQEVYHSLSQADYVTVFAVTVNGRVPLVRQFRPAIQGVSVELPGGMADSGETPAASAERELFEETGYRLVKPLVQLGCLAPDTGRLENRLWGYFASDVEHAPNWQPEMSVESFLMDLDQFKLAVREGSFNNALHVALVGLAQFRGLI